MSYNIDSVETKVLDAWMQIEDLQRLAQDEDELPEVDFVREHLDETPDEHGRVRLNNFWWYGEGSGNAYEHLQKVVAPLIHGHVEAIFTWEGGDSHSGLIVKDGTVIECDVKQMLVPKKSRRKP